MQPAQKWTVFQKNGTCFSFSYPCLSFYFTPIPIPSTLQNKPKQPFNSEDFFTVRWCDWVRCQARELRSRCQGPELGSSCQGPTPGGETSKAPAWTPQTREACALQPSRGPAKDMGRLLTQLSLWLISSKVKRQPQSPGTASPRPPWPAEALAVTTRGSGRTLVF